jgi:hypothetical protein
VQYRWTCLVAGVGVRSGHAVIAINMLIRSLSTLWARAVTSTGAAAA